MNTIADASILRGLGLRLERDDQNVAQPVALETVSVCAWCDWQKIETRALMAQGKRVSHTCCAEHTRELLARARELNQHKEAA